MEPICLPQFDTACAVKACGHPKAPNFNAKPTVSERVALGLSDEPKTVELVVTIKGQPVREVDEQCFAVGPYSRDGFSAHRAGFPGDGWIVKLNGIGRSATQRLVEPCGNPVNFWSLWHSDGPILE